MTLLMLEGFDDYASGLLWPRASVWDFGSPATDRSASWAPRTGLGHLKVDQARNWRVVLPGASEHALLAVGHGYLYGISILSQVIGLRSDAGLTDHVSVWRTTNWALEARRGSTVLATTAGGLFTPGVYHYVELEALLSDTVGTIKVWLNGALLINLSGIDTKNAGTKTVFDSVGSQGASNSGATWMDDLYISNGAGSLNVGRIGEMRVETKYMNGNGNYSQLLGSDGNSVNNFEQVGEQGAPLTADYNGSATDGQKDTYATEDLSVGAATIYGAEVRMYAAKTDAGAKSMRHIHRRGGVDSVGPDRVLATAYDTYHDILERDPNGPTAWTVANFNASEFGAEVRP